MLAAPPHSGLGSIINQLIRLRNYNGPRTAGGHKASSVHLFSCFADCAHLFAFGVVLGGGRDTLHHGEKEVEYIEK